MWADVRYISYCIAVLFMGACGPSPIVAIPVFGLILWLPASIWLALYLLRSRGLQQPATWAEFRSPVGDILMVLGHVGTLYAVWISLPPRTAASLGLIFVVPWCLFWYVLGIGCTHLDFKLSSSRAANE